MLRHSVLVSSKTRVKGIITLLKGIKRLISVRAVDQRLQITILIHLILGAAILVQVRLRCITKRIKSLSCEARTVVGAHIHVNQSLCHQIELGCSQSYKPFERIVDLRPLKVAHLALVSYDLI